MADPGTLVGLFSFQSLFCASKKVRVGTAFIGQLGDVGGLNRGLSLIGNGVADTLRRPENNQGLGV
jgi:hypothetical protein